MRISDLTRMFSEFCLDHGIPEVNLQFTWDGRKFTELSPSIIRDGKERRDELPVDPAYRSLGLLLDERRYGIEMGLLDGAASKLGTVRATGTFNFGAEAHFTLTADVTSLYRGLESHNSVEWTAYPEAEETLDL